MPRGLPGTSFGRGLGGHLPPSAFEIRGGNMSVKILPPLEKTEMTSLMPTLGYAI